MHKKRKFQSPRKATLFCFVPLLRSCQRLKSSISQIGCWINKEKCRAMRLISTRYKASVIEFTKFKNHNSNHSTVSAPRMLNPSKARYYKISAIAGSWTPRAYSASSILYTSFNIARRQAPSLLSKAYFNQTRPGSESPGGDALVFANMLACIYLE